MRVTNKKGWSFDTGKMRRYRRLAETGGIWKGWGWE